MWTSRLLYLIGCLVLGLAILQLVPFFYALANDEAGAFEAFGASIFYTGLIGGSLYLGFKDTAQMRTPLLTISLPFFGLLAAALVIGLPFLFVFPERGIAAAFYEGVSMFTTNGSSAYLGSISEYQSLILWQAISAWCGGMGFVAYALSLLTALNVGGIQLHHSSLPFGDSDTGYLRLIGTAKTLVPVYMLATMTCLILLLLSGSSFFDATILSFSALSTTGLVSYKGAVIGDGITQFVVALFILLSMMNWDFIYTRLKTQRLQANDRFELRAAFALIVIAVFAFMLVFDVRSVERVWDAVFLSISLMSTTGFAGGEALWPAEASNPIMIISLLLVSIGGAAISTTGGLKLLRLGVLLTVVRSEISRLAHPSSIRRSKYNDEPIQYSDFEALWLSLAGFVVTVIVGCLLLAVMGISFQHAVALSISAITSSGPSIFTMDPQFYGFSGLTDPDYVILSLLMIIGRIEISVMLALFAKAIWQR